MTPYENMMQIAYYLAAFIGVFTILAWLNYYKYYCNKEEKR